jgi:hypothetical protein
MSRYLSFTSVIFLLLIVSCQKEKSFELGKLSQGSLQDSLGDCLSKTVAGTFIAAKALNDSNFIDVTVNVTQTGRYTVYTDTVNGYSFKATGTFTILGSNTVRMKGLGTPAVAGTDDFTIFYDSSFCDVSVTVLPSGSSGGSTSTDHFILTDNSWWSYTISILPTDTLKRSIISGSFNVGSISYKGMQEEDAGGNFDDTLFFRKSGNNYYEYNYVDYYTSFYFDNSIVDSILFLKEGLTTGQTWSSPVYTGTDSGATKKLRYDFTCTNASATVTLNSKAYTNVYQVTMKAMVDDGSGFKTDLTWTNYYAQGIGWIYQKYDDGQGGVYDIPIKNYKVL